MRLRVYCVIQATGSQCDYLLQDDLALQQDRRISSEPAGDTGAACF